VDRTSPDNAAGWDRLAAAYQRDVGWPEDELSWGLRCPTERELRLVSDVVRGADTVVLGCGGGQDLVALGRLGAATLTGVDPSAEQLAHAARRAEAAGMDVHLVRAGAEQLDALGDEVADLVVSVQALDYVADLAACFAEVRRILRPGGRLAFSVLHPADLSTEDPPPHGWHTSYFTEQRDWEWDGLADRPVRLRSWFRSPANWFTAVTAAGLQVTRLLEPAPVDDPRWRQLGWLDATTEAKLDLVPGTIALTAVRPRHRR
jgi:SAM-dependent methyltransferase